MTYDDRQKIMSNAVIDMIHGSNMLERLFPVEKSAFLDTCAATTIKSCKCNLDCAIRLLVDAINWEREACENSLEEEGI